MPLALQLHATICDRGLHYDPAVGSSFSRDGSTTQVRRRGAAKIHTNTDFLTGWNVNNL